VYSKILNKSGKILNSCTKIKSGTKQLNFLSGYLDSVLKVRLFKFKNDISYRIAHLLYHELIPIIISPFVIKSLIVHDRKWFEQQLVVNVYTLTTGTYIYSLLSFFYF
jgi:hypothetical protein